MKGEERRRNNFSLIKVAFIRTSTDNYPIHMTGIDRTTLGHYIFFLFLN